MYALSAPEIALIIVQVTLFIFWIWMLIEFIRDKRFTGATRAWWLVMMILFGAITAIWYFFMHYTKED